MSTTHYARVGLVRLLTPSARALWSQHRSYRTVLVHGSILLIASGLVHGAVGLDRRLVDRPGVVAKAGSVRAVIRRDRTVCGRHPFPRYRIAGCSVA